MGNLLLSRLLRASRSSARASWRASRPIRQAPARSRAAVRLHRQLGQSWLALASRRVPQA
ncbi:MAG: hypothetical protein AMJ62_15740 [Myxococcales bacterium SG8_38]|nr:MAG: hypothetical protein AMJ62_15740 [Myxococcales bacterium SG8_38]